MFDTIRLLTELSGPCGQEEAVQAFVETYWRERGARVERTRTGSVLGRLGGSGPKVLLVAHADELCYLVRSIDAGGYLWLANGQAWNRTASIRQGFYPGQRVRVLARTGELPGTLAAITGHTSGFLREATEYTWDDFWVDTGLSRNELVERGVTPGTRIIWDARTERIGAHVVGKAFDDRGGVAILCELVRRIAGQSLGCALTVATTVQEEIGGIGAAALAGREEFDAAIVVESGQAGDVPRVGESYVPLRLGAGPALVHKDGMVHYDHALTARIEQLAASEGIPIQPAVLGFIGTDGSLLMKGGIPTACLSFPTRYTHSPFETVHQRDLELMVSLLEAFVRFRGL
jgi:endoglucanase